MKLSPIVTAIILTLLISCTSLPNSTRQVLPKSTGLSITPIGGSAFKAPKGWTLDNKSGSSQGVLLAAYPVGQSYANSPVIAYARSIPRDSKTNSAADASAANVKYFQANGHHEHRTKFITNIKTQGGAYGAIYAFEGDNWNNFEAACYFVESNTINSIIFHSKDRKSYDHEWGNFLKLCKSYVPVFVSN